MPESNEQLTLKKIIGAILFAAKKPLKPDEIKKLFGETADLGYAGGSADSPSRSAMAERGARMEEEAVCRQFAKVKESEIAAALEQIKIEYVQSANGIQIIEVAGGFRLQTDPECSPWLRQLLNTGRPTRLSKPTLETLAIIAYRQPVNRSEIESVRGVNVDAIVRHLLDCQLIKITGRSNLPGHPLLYGTTQLFLEHFGLQSIDHLPGIEQLRRKEEERARAARQQNAQQKEDPQNEKEDEYEDDENDDDEESDEIEEKEMNKEEKHDLTQEKARQTTSNQDGKK